MSLSVKLKVPSLMTPECPDDNGCRDGSDERLGVQDHEFIHTHGCTFIWATSGPAERSDDLHPPQGARGSAARFCLPTVDILCALWKNTAPDGFSSSEHG